MSNLVNHANRELNTVGLFDEDSDYSGQLGQAVMELMEVFAKQDHSGMSASMTRELFYQLSDFKALSSLTNNPHEWQEVHRGTWQNRRQSNAFSLDGGKTYYVLDTQRKWLRRIVTQSLWSRMPRHWQYPFKTAKEVTK